MIWRWTLPLFLAFAASCGRAYVKPRGSHTIHSKKIGDDFTISFRTSEGFDPSKPFTLIYITDATLGLGKYALEEDSSPRASLPHNAVLVAIGHVDDPKKKKRARDFLPTNADSKQKENFGRADRFYDFLKTEIMPFVEKNFPGASKKVLIGHSFGCLFCLYAALKNEGLFDGYYVISPSVWANHRELFKIEQAFSERNKNFRADIRMYVGGLEVFNRVLSSTKDFYRVLQGRNYEGLSVSLELIPGANHFSIRKPAIDRILKLLGA